MVECVIQIDQINQSDQEDYISCLVPLTEPIEDNNLSETDVNINSIFNENNTSDENVKKIINVKKIDNQILTYFSYNILNDQNNEYEHLYILNFISYCNNIFVYDIKQLDKVEFNIRYNSCERDILYVKKPSIGSRIYLANFNNNCNTEYISHLDCDSNINLYEDKILSLFTKYKNIDFDENGKLCNIQFSEEVNKLEISKKIINDLNNKKFNDKDILIRFTINSNGDVTDSTMMIIIDTEELE